MTEHTKSELPPALWDAVEGPNGWWAVRASGSDVAIARATESVARAIVSIPCKTEEIDRLRMRIAELEEIAVQCLETEISEATMERTAMYCAGGCAQIARRERLREAGQRYQTSRRGRVAHAQRDRPDRDQQLHLRRLANGSDPEVDP
jgi:hypothetical protein